MSELDDNLIVSAVGIFRALVQCEREKTSSPVERVDGILNQRS
jgi:hypothetical protein